MRKLYLLIAFMVLACSAVMANDSVFFVNGNQLIPSENETDISVQKEVLTISLQDDGKTKVNVYYEFNNKSQKAKTVLMGFEANPPYNADCKYNAKGIHPYISNFSVNMNGKDVSYSNAVVELNTPQGFKPLDTKAWKTGEAFDESNGQMLDNGNLSINFAYAYYFKATFEPGLNKIVHAYDYLTSYGVMSAFLVNYKLSPALRWANKQIDDFTLVVRADNTAKHYVMNYAPFKNGEFKLLSGAGKYRVNKRYDIDCFEFTLRNGAFSWHANNFKPEEELNISSAESLYEYIEDNKEVYTLGSSYDRSKSFIWWHPIKTDFEVRVARNLPYAHRGHVFKKAEMKEFFEKQWWYMPDPEYKDDTSDFTEKDWDFIKTKKSAE